VLIEFAVIKNENIENEGEVEKNKSCGSRSRLARERREFV
jgi:hypothetical protein